MTPGKSQIEAMNKAYEAFLKDGESLGITSSSEIHYAWTRAWISSYDHQRMQGLATIPDRAKPQPEPQGDGWIEWKGGDCPVTADTIVEVRLWKGTILSRKACIFNWRRNGWETDILAYRLPSPQ